MTDSDSQKAVMPTATNSAGDSREEAAALREAALRREAARQMGQAKSERKRAAVRENGKKGGRPRGGQTSAEARARMSAAQQERRAREQQSIVESGAEN